MNNLATHTIHTHHSQSFVSHIIMLFVAYCEQKVKQIYQNVENGPTAYFYLYDEIKTIGLSSHCKTDKWKIPQESLDELKVL